MWGHFRFAGRGIPKSCELAEVMPSAANRMNVVTPSAKTPLGQRLSLRYSEAKAVQEAAEFV
jgi:hypothetical protein